MRREFFSVMRRVWCEQAARVTSPEVGYILQYVATQDTSLSSGTPGDTAGLALILVSRGNRGIAQLPDGRQLDVHFRRGVGRPLCGDWVRLEDSADDTAVVTAIEPRRNHFARADARQRKQLVAANLDIVLIVIAPLPPPGRDVLERYLVAVHSLDIQPVIVVNKVELPQAIQPEPDSPLARISDYQALGYRVLRTSCKGPPGVREARGVVSGHTSILVGQSGVGKSSLVNRLVPDLEVQTGTLSRATGKGRHTTTGTMMYVLPGNDGYLVDSPGVWEFGLWDLRLDDLEHGFVEFRPFLGQCRFNDCAHDSEPDCAIKQATRRGDIRDWRYQAYARLLQK